MPLIIPPLKDVIGFKTDVLVRFDAAVPAPAYGDGEYNYFNVDSVSTYNLNLDFESNLNFNLKLSSNPLETPTHREDGDEDLFLDVTQRSLGYADLRSNTAPESTFEVRF